MPDATTLLPDVRRIPLRPPHSSEFTSWIVQMALGVTYRAMAAGKGEPFVDPPEPEAPEPLAYTTDDGWTCYLHRCPAPPGAPGEPVLLVHGLGFNRFSMDYRGPCSLLGMIRNAGFEAWVLEHRADASAVPPRRPQPFDVDTIATQDVPTAIRAIQERTGAKRIGWVGHGLGGQLLYIHLATDPCSPLFAAVTLGAAVRFPKPRSLARQAALVARLLPSRIGIPTGRILRLMSPLAPGPGDERTAGAIGDVEGPRIRGLLNFAGQDMGVRLVAQVGRWIASGRLCDADDRVDYIESLYEPKVPLMVVASDGDDLAPPDAASPVLDVWKGPHKLLVPEGHPSHMALVQGGKSVEAAWVEVASWLAAWRSESW